MFRCGLFLAIAVVAQVVAVAPWSDCSEAEGHEGPFDVTLDTSVELFPTYRPTDLSGRQWPVFVWMHGGGCDHRLSTHSLTRYASHGFIVVAPMMGNEKECTNALEIMNCVDQSPDGRFIQEGIQWIRNQNADIASVFYGRVDTQSMAIGGWSMGGVSAIRAAAAMPQDHRVLAVILDSPSVDCCALMYNYTQSQIEEAWLNANEKINSILLMTSSNDFLQPSTLKLFQSAEAYPGSQVYAQFPEERCVDNPPFYHTTIWSDWLLYFGGWRGHCCAGLLTSSRLTTTFLKLTLQQHSSRQSRCHATLWWGEGALANEQLDAFHRKKMASSDIVVVKAMQPPDWLPWAWSWFIHLTCLIIFIGFFVVLPLRIFTTFLCGKCSTSVKIKDK